MDNTEYENCPFCQSKKIYKKEVGTPTRILVMCGECDNQIDSYPKDVQNG